MPLSIATFQNEITSLGNIYRAMELRQLQVGA